MNTTLHNKAAALAQLHEEYKNYPGLRIAHASSNLVFGHGHAHARIVFIGEAPGEQEDKLGEPFVGKSGQLLNKLFQAIGIERTQEYITNAVKVRPPHNRKPTTQEILDARDLLMQQLAIINPTIICTLGSTALQALTQTVQPITKVRGKLIEVDALRIYPTYHPAYILRNPKELATLYHDLEQVYTLAYPERT